MKTKKKPSVIPIYGVAAVWVLLTIFHGMYTAGNILLAIVLSVIAYTLLSVLFPAKTVQDEPKQQKAAAQPKAKEDPEIAALKSEKDKAVSEMRRLDNNIADPQISASIQHLEVTTGKIFDVVIAKPAKKKQISTFFSYYLPTTIKLLNAYDRADSAGISGSNIDNTKQRVRDMLSEIEKAFDKQLDSLYGDEALDITTDIKVMESMLKEEGIAEEASPFAGV